MIGPYLDDNELNELNKTLSDYVIEDTLSCWKATRINGASAQMACGGNISLPLIKMLDMAVNLKKVQDNDK